MALFQVLRNFEMVDTYTGPLIDLYPIQPTLKQNPSLRFTLIFTSEKEPCKTDYLASISTGPAVLDQACPCGSMVGARSRQVLQDHPLLINPICFI